jgi:hypothetical protein
VDAAEQERQAETRRRLDALIAATAPELRAAGDDREATAAAIRRFLDAAVDILFHPSALWFEFMAALKQAGFDHRQQDRRLRIYGTVSHERFGGGRPLPANWPWFEHEGPEQDAEPGAAPDPAA